MRRDKQDYANHTILNRQAVTDLKVTVQEQTRIHIQQIQQFREEKKALSLR